MMRRCYKCGETKSDDSFYRDASRADGLKSACKPCSNAALSAYRATPEGAARSRAITRKYAKTEKGRVALRRGDKKRVQAHPEKKRARILVQNAIKRGKMQRKPCRVCGERGEAHHEDYSKPFEVDWLCAFHHRAEHGKAA